MNTQRWLALGILVLVVLCAVFNDLWLPLIIDDDEEIPPTPETAAVEEGAAGTPDGEEPDTLPGALPTPTPEPAFDPVIAEILADLQIEDLGIGLDPFITRAGDFVVIDSMHQGEGTASIYRLTELQYVLRLAPFNVTTGPDLRVILSEHPAPRTSTETLLPTYIDLGPLKSPNGSQNYEIPEGVDLQAYRSVAIYSMSLNIVYTTATLTDVRGQ